MINDLTAPLTSPFSQVTGRKGRERGLAVTSRPGDRSRGPLRAGPPETHILPVCQRLETEYWESEKVRSPNVLMGHNVPVTCRCITTHSNRKWQKTKHSMLRFGQGMQEWPPSAL